ncbi:hypothetical protein KZX46_22390 (plasmid) [Polymorphobacter sp. PAMC 29334]|uniref:hypothetical protein n=1 Tax=Polymorphobacter sp. PAMC 29334 TaxID=2862331 RepID=UPI001C796800|nr:hypothetical protein [Polymorphobacter sp. PAMC 29334]QYE37304.1 hypothetical protein KZX46_22390 [Polymorphobacter sp. PAMC 29334]
MDQHNNLRSTLTGAVILLAVSSCGMATGKPAVTSKTNYTDLQTIGVATEEADGTIVLTLRAVGNGAIGDGQFRYPKNHPQYAMIAAHVGPIPKGGSVAVKPFQEEAK